MLRYITAAVLCLVSAAAQAGPSYDTGIGNAPDASLAYVGNALSGQNLSAGVLSLGSASEAIDGNLEFRTGVYAGTDAAGDLFFNGGGFLNLTGILFGVPESLYTATFTGTSEVVSLGGGSYRVLAAPVTGTVSQDLAVAFGQPEDAGMHAGGLSLLFTTTPQGVLTLASGNLAFDVSPTISSVPEPASALMVVVGLVGAGLAARKRVM